MRLLLVTRFGIGLASLLLTTSPTFAATLTLSRLQLVLGPPTGLEKVHCNGTFTPDPTVGKADLRAVQVLFQLSIPTPAGPNVFYKQVIPAGGFTTTDGINYSLTPDAANASGLASFTLSWTGTGWAVEFMDNQATVANADYSTVTTTIVIGTDPGSSTDHLTQAGSTWQL